MRRSDQQKNIIKILLDALAEKRAFRVWTYIRQSTRKSINGFSKIMRFHASMVRGLLNHLPVIISVAQHRGFAPASAEEGGVASMHL
jgi:hypothetical protein